MSDPFEAIRLDRLALADLLDTLTAGQWAVQSLCGSWNVHEVATHLTVGPTASMAQFAKAMLKARGKFDRANQLLVESKLAPPEQLVSTLRSIAGSRFTPPTFDWHAPLTDIRVHSLDITVPLGLTLDVPAAPWSDVLNFLVSKKALTGFVQHTPPRPDVRLTATDVDWSHGTGGVVSGPAASLAAALAGRPAGLDGLGGDGVPAFRRWVEG